MAFSPAPRLYFAYGSSLSTSEMQSQCPTSTFHGIAVLRNHRWFVNERGYANIMPSLPGANGTEDVVWGILYTLRPFDEELLDKHQGMPWAYTKADMDVETVSITEDGRGTRREVVRALVYIDRERIQESYPWPEFVVKMNKGIQEAAERGLPGVWISRVVRSYIADPSTLSATEGQSEPEAGPPVHNGALPAPATRPESDHASQKPESVVEAPLVNGGFQKASSTQTNQLRGLQNSKYAHESPSNTSGASQRRAKEVATTQKTPSGHQARTNKQLECWWWKVKGSCRFPDNQCAYAHHITGFVAEAPASQKRGTSLEKINPPVHLNSVPRREKNPPFKAGTGKENHEHPGRYKQDWGGQQNHGEANPWSGEQQSTADVNPSWGEQPGKTEANPSWSDQVENLMDSDPDWLMANDRKDVKW
ncbi:hypothetical protein GJ744_009146 [Endocarpon pusillum]|uniref:gamma-glutamylcyclotransferase n=1 Tax=Endocarpon pusillum TaxID=364733 RepID=A0A8H7AKF1_9EURO|nr:hypothetical protein GJ744_009146 [Endocarpon pusillum]